MGICRVVGYCSDFADDPHFAANFTAVGTLMAIEFPCPHCTQLLRVGDDSAGKTAKCPKCNGLAKIPGGDAPPSFGPPAGSLGAPLPSSFDPPSTSSYGDASASKNPFSDGGAASNPYSSQPKFGAPDPYVNPYASPMVAYQAPTMDVAINPQVVGVEPILSYAWQLWQENLGLLLGVTIVVAVITNVISYGAQFLQMVLIQNNEREFAQAVGVVAFFVSYAVQIFLGIGEKQILLKICRRQPAQFSDLFGGASLFAPVLGVTILFVIAFFLGLALLIIPAIIVALIWWPTFSLVVDRKAGIIESFSVAASITKDNWGTTILLWLLSVGIILLGCLALCIGVFFAAPLVSMLWGVAYLMMSGQIPVYGQQYGQPQQPPKW